jgi:hypothetical protein
LCLLGILFVLRGRNVLQDDRMVGRAASEPVPVGRPPRINP